MSFFQFLSLCSSFSLMFQACTASYQHSDIIYPGFKTSQILTIDHNGLFLLSNNSIFAFGFHNHENVTLFALVVIHINSSMVVWTANTEFLVKNSDKFVFDNTGDVYLESTKGLVWSTNTGGQGAKVLELLDSGNLVLLGKNGKTLWQSFSHPTDTLLSSQEFSEGMQLRSSPNQNNLYHYLAIEAGDMVLSAAFETPQIYWSLGDDKRKTNNNVSGNVYMASLMSNSWNFYDHNGLLLWEFMFAEDPDSYATWAAVLDSTGSIAFYNLLKGKSVDPEGMRIPENSCSTPEPCDPYFVCNSDNRCQCPVLLRDEFDCKPRKISACNSSRSSAEFLYVGEELNYFSLGFVSPILKSNIDACKQACLGNCSCLVLFFNNSSGNCFLYDQIGSLQRADVGSAGYVSYMKFSGDEVSLNSPIEPSANGMKHALVTSVIAITTSVVIFILLYAIFRCRRENKTIEESSDVTLEEEFFLDSFFPWMPIRYSYNELCRATNNFSVKVGQGGFGSVYLGTLSNSAQVAVKKLEGVEQGMKEFKAEVSLIGSIHHVHLVKLKGFCTEGPHRLLVYEYMGKGSLDKWIFKSNKEISPLLDWNTRSSIALGMAKGLAYLHEECEAKIIHCDIKPEIVLLDDNFAAKISDFGLSKLMNREQSLVCTQLRGTRGYLAPEWIFNYAISEKSDVYSFGMVLLELIGGRKNYDSGKNLEEAHFPSYAFKMLEQERVKEIMDSKLEVDEKDMRIVNAIKVALWCIQEDMNLRPPMSKVVQMLEGVRPVPQPPTSSQLGSLSSFSKWSSEARSAGTNGCFSDARQSDIRLSGPR